MRDRVRVRVRGLRGEERRWVGMDARRGDLKWDQEQEGRGKGPRREKEDRGNDPRFGRRDKRR